MKKFAVLSVFVLGCAGTPKPPPAAPVQTTCSPPPPGAYVLKTERTRGTCSFPRFYEVTLNGKDFFKFGDKNCKHEVKLGASQCGQEVYTMCPFTYQEADHTDNVHRGTAVKEGRILSKGEYEYNFGYTSLEAMTGKQTTRTTSIEVLL